MLMRALAFAALLAAAAAGGQVATPAMSQTQDAAISVAELMQATALDEVFTQFGATIGAAPAESGQFDPRLAGVWAEAAREVFDARSMHGALARSLEGRLPPEDQAVLARFFRSDFGQRITELERSVQTLGRAAQVEAQAEGQAVLDAMDADSQRARQLDEMLTLANTEIANAMVGQSIRGMLIGMSLSQQRGDIEVPWEEIDAHLAAILPVIRADVAAAQRAIVAYTYRDLPAADLDAYLEFLRTSAAQKFYALASYSIGTIVTDMMTRFGHTMAAKMGRVNV